jgi:serine/threonine protein kinase
VASTPTTHTGQPPHPQDVSFDLGHPASITGQEPDAQALAAEALVARLAEEMAADWHKGDLRPVEHFLDQHAELRDSPAAVLDLLYEEVCLRRERGETVAVEEIIRRFPHWKQQIEILLNCAQALEAPSLPRFPDVGETFGDFKLVTQLGRGGQGVVFAATQSSLGDRPVVLKVTARRGDEHLSLARLQHTHIVPLLSAVEDAARNLRLLCMPYFGGLTLAALLAELAGRPPAQRTGRQLLECLETARAAASFALSPGRDPAVQFLERASYVQAITWLGACLAEALKYAHERGLVHLDLKPSNVLLTADRQPMLLDFHLAREPLRAGDLGVRFGGTPVYMSPEQKRAMAAIKEGNPVPETIDGRSDVHSLGVLLYEALAGELPSDGQDLWPPLERCNPQVSAGLSDIIAKCSAARPEKRYQDAGTLAADLWAHLDDLPLKGVTNRSMRERWRKLRRRKPHLLKVFFLLGAVVALMAVAAIIAGTHFSHRVREAGSALEEGNKLLKTGRYGDGVTAFKRGLAQLESLPWNRNLQRQLSDRLRLAARGQAAQELHGIADHFRFLPGVDFAPSAGLQNLERQCQAIWNRRDLILDRLGKELAPEIEQRIHLDLLDLAVLGADLRVRLSDQGRAAAARQEALQMLAQAETFSGPNAVLYHERRAYAEALGRDDLVRETDRRASGYPPRTAWEHYALGRSLLGAHKPELAVGHLHRALALEPGGLWPSFYHGVCSYQLRKFEDAAISFTTCAALAPAPMRARCFYYRGLAFEGVRRTDRALEDFSHALKLDPSFADAAFHRGLMQLREKRLGEAAADFRRALDNGINPAQGHFLLARVCLAREDRAGAIAHLRQSRRFDPSHKEATELLKKLEKLP